MLVCVNEKFATTTIKQAKEKVFEATGGKKAAKEQEAKSKKKAPAAAAVAAAGASSSSEGAAAASVAAAPPAMVGGLPRSAADGKIDYSADFFGKPAFLTVSGQLNGEKMFFFRVFFSTEFFDEKKVLHLDQKISK